MIIIDNMKKIFCIYYFSIIILIVDVLYYKAFLNLIVRIHKLQLCELIIIHLSIENLK